MRSIISLSSDELEEVMQTGVWPEDATLDGLEEHKDFNLLFRHRSNPRMLAKQLLKHTTASDNVSIREKRTLLKQKELELREQRMGMSVNIGNALRDMQLQLQRIEALVVKLLTERRE